MTIMFPSQVLFLVHFASELLSNIPLADRERKWSLTCVHGCLCVCASMGGYLCVCAYESVHTGECPMKSFPMHVLWRLPEGPKSWPLAYLSPFTPCLMQKCECHFHFSPSWASPGGLSPAEPTRGGTSRPSSPCGCSAC